MEISRRHFYLSRFRNLILWSSGGRRATHGCDASGRHANGKRYLGPNWPISFNAIIDKAILFFIPGLQFLFVWCLRYSCICIFVARSIPHLWSSGHSSWLQTQRPRARFAALPHFLRSNESGAGSTQPRENK
jgi:hypothetical protein